MVSKSILQHPWVVAAENLLLVMALYTLSRLFFVWVNSDLFGTLEAAHLLEMMVGGMRFDLTAILYLSSLYLLLMLIPLSLRIRQSRGYQTVAKWTLWVPNIVGLVANTIDMVYVRYTDRRTTCTIFSEFANDNNIAQILGEGIVQYWYVSLFGIAIIALLIVLTRSAYLPREHSMQVSATTYQPFITYHLEPERISTRKKVLISLRETAIFLLSIYFVVIGIRGGFGAYTRPINISNALQYTNQPNETMIVLNTPFSIFETVQTETYHEVHYYPEDEVALVMNPERGVQSAECREQNAELNVVVMILESFSKEYIGYYNHELDGGTYRGYTPFLDSLLSRSVTYQYSYASGRKSIDAMPSVLSSIPMLIEPYVVTPYATNRVSSIADCLGKKGYTTAFFHGAPNGSMGFQAYARAAGFGAYYGMDEYDGPEAFDGTWAIWDEEFLQYYGRTMSTMEEPFMTAVFTASSHHPFRIPERYEGHFDAGTHPIHPCIGYSDHALRQFFAYAEKQPWYAHTLFVLTADHTNQLTHPEYQNARGMYEVPIAFYSPALAPKMDRTNVVSQTDIMPSVLAYVGYDEPYFAFGEDALTGNKVHNYAICYNHPLYQLMTREGMIQTDGADTTVDTTNDPEALPYLKAYIQQYIHRMITNELTVGRGYNN